MRGRCMRNTIYTERTCSREGKQRRCYAKYQEKLAKKLLKPVKKISSRVKKDESYEELVAKVWQRDAGFLPESRQREDWWKYCRFFRSLFDSERKIFLDRNNDLLWMCVNLDCAHRESKGSRPDQKYMVDNVFLLNRLAHSRLDSYQNPITGEAIDAAERDAWFDRIAENVKSS